MKDLAPVLEMATPEARQQLFLTEAQIRKYPQFTDASQEEIINIINSLHQLALITYEIVSREINSKAQIQEAA